MLRVLGLIPLEVAGEAQPDVTAITMVIPMATERMLLLQGLMVLALIRSSAFL
jgi:hypothetical protein